MRLFHFFVCLFIAITCAFPVYAGDEDIPLPPLLQRYYDSGLIVDHYIDAEGAGELEVTDLFLRLSEEDRFKALVEIDKMVGFLKAPGAEMFSIEHDRTGDLIGVFTPLGIQYGR